MQGSRFTFLWKHIYPQRTFISQCQTARLFSGLCICIRRKWLGQRIWQTKLSLKRRKPDGEIWRRAEMRENEKGHSHASSPIRLFSSYTRRICNATFPSQICDMSYFLVEGSERIMQTHHPKWDDIPSSCILAKAGPRAPSKSCCIHLLQYHTGVPKDPPLITSSGNEANAEERGKGGHTLNSIN